MAAGAGGVNVPDPADWSAEIAGEGGAILPGRGRTRPAGNRANPFTVI
jgi:hypothetical protein